MTQDYLMGSERPVFGGGQAKNITFVVTEQCNLACKYCYMTGKNNRSVMTFDVAKKAVDYALGTFQDSPAIIWEFIGGEPLLEIDLIDQISDYIKLQMYSLDHPWFNNYRFNITTNGLLYDHPKVQKYFRKNHSKLTVTISLDGNETKHNMQRVKPDGSGSYQDVVKNIPLWIKQFPHSTVKATYSSEDLPYIKDSIISLWDLGLTIVPANVVYEDVWKDGDDKLFEEQLKSLADYIVDHKLWNTVSCSFFDDKIGFPVNKQYQQKNWCSCGDILAVDHKGDIYPCIRFLPFCIQKKPSFPLGNVETGVNFDLLRPYQSLDFPSQSTDECLNCEVGKGCGWCQGYNYDEADTETIFQRAIYLCKMHKARCRANDYYWARLKNEANISRKSSLQRRKALYFLLENDSVPYCDYKNTFSENRQMSLETFKTGLEYAKENFLTPILLHGSKPLTPEFLQEIKYIEVLNFYPSTHEKIDNSSIIIFNNDVPQVHNVSNCILLINKTNLDKIPEIVEKIFASIPRINLILENSYEFTAEDFEKYDQALDALVELLFAKYLQHDEYREINILTDVMLSSQMQNCNAGINSLTLAPDSNLYYCPAFYYQNQTNSLGNLLDGFTIKNPHLLTLEKSPICSQCDSYQCKRCIKMNKTYTREFSIPTSKQCKISHLERQKSYNIQQKLLKANPGSPYLTNLLFELEYDDPFLKVTNKSKKRE